MELRSYVHKWIPATEISSYSDEVFLRFIDKAVIERIRRTESNESTDSTALEEPDEDKAELYCITFYFKCGMILTEEVSA